MNVFIGWSGNTSKQIGEVFNSWLPSVLQRVKPYFTPSDIDKGARWNSEISEKLENSEIGILCLTRDSLQNNDWLIFEAGALSKKLDKSNVCPILFGIENTDLQGPLKQFQTTTFKKSDVKKLMELMNSKLDKDKLLENVLAEVFDKWWPDLEKKVKAILSAKPDIRNVTPIRNDRQLIEEILTLTRQISQRPLSGQPSGIDPMAIKELLLNYIKIHDGNAIGKEGNQETLNTLFNMKKAVTYFIKRSLMPTKEKEELLKKLDYLTFKYEEKGEEVPF